MHTRKKFSSGTKWEDIVGYSRAVRIGDQLEVSGTVASDEKGVVGKGDFYAQTKFIFQKIEKTMIEAGFALKDIVRTRVFVTDISQWAAVGRAHHEIFKEIRPASSMIEVSAFIDPEFLVEIEVTAIKDPRI